MIGKIMGTCRDIVAEEVCKYTTMGGSNETSEAGS